MSKEERLNQYQLLNDTLKEKITNTIVRHNIINNIIDNKDYNKVMELNK